MDATCQPGIVRRWSERHAAATRPDQGTFPLLTPRTPWGRLGRAGGGSSDLSRGVNSRRPKTTLKASAALWVPCCRGDGSSGTGSSWAQLPGAVLWGPRGVPDPRGSCSRGTPAAEEPRGARPARLGGSPSLPLPGIVCQPWHCAGQSPAAAPMLRTREAAAYQGPALPQASVEPQAGTSGARPCQALSCLPQPHAATWVPPRSNLARASPPLLPWGS